MAIKNISEGSSIFEPITQETFARPKIILPSFMPEQIAIIDSNEPVIKVRAGAGTGKTTTLTGYAARRMDARILYIAFNKAIQEEAATKFTQNVTCRTTHSIAYSAMNVGQNYSHKLVPSVRPKTISMELGVENWKGVLAISTINEFLYSKDKDIGEKHAMAAFVKISIHDEIVALARKVWKKMIDPRDDSIGITHDSYLKLFHLSERRIPGNYDIIMMDEGQDANPVTSAIVAQQPGGKVYVGDRNQSIYAFRGAENAMDAIDATEYFLSSSFRFGPQVANVANHLLEYSLGDSARIIGAGGQSTINRTHPNGRHALLARTNGSLFFAATSALDAGKTVSIIGGPESLRLTMLMDVYRLSTGDQGRISEIFTPVIKQFQSYEKMREEVSNEEAEDVEMNSLCKVVDNYGGRLPALIAKISAKCNVSTSDADVVLATAHKSKGLEFDSVELADDFKKPNDDDGIEIQEANLLYVAVTRAKKNLVLSASMNDFMREPKKNVLLVQERLRKFNKMGA